MTDTKKSKGSRGWVFTLNNYTEEEELLLRNVTCKYIIFGKEVAPTTGTPHLQGYIEFKDAKTLSATKKYLGTNRISLRVRHGTPQEARDYCTKGENIHERGVLPMENGHRRGLAEVCEKILAGAPIEEVASDYPSEFVRYSGGLQKLCTTKIQPRDPNNPPNVIWMWGLAGTGKTRTAYESHQRVYIKDGTQWWDGYDGQEAIVIDDFDPIEWNYRDFLRLLDRYPYRGQFKGGYVNVNSPYIYITCEYHPMKFWNGNKLAQVTRRLTTIKEIVAPQGNSPQGDLGNTRLSHQKQEKEEEKEEMKPVFYQLINKTT